MRFKGAVTPVTVSSLNAPAAQAKEPVFMGMACEIRALTERQIEALLANPARVWDVAFGDEDDDEEDDEREEDLDEEEDEERIEALLGEPLREELYLDKSWDILRYLLRKSAGHRFRDDGHPPSELIYGELLAEPEIHGPHLRRVKETRDFADFLRPLTEDRLLELFNWQEMSKADVYLIAGDPGPREEQELREYAAQHFQALREYVLNAADSHCGLLLWVA
jgi:hypothetical protein